MPPEPTACARVRRAGQGLDLRRHRLHLADVASVRGPAEGRRCRGRPRRTAAPGGPRAPSGPPARPAGRCRRSGSRSVATVSFSFTHGRGAQLPQPLQRGAPVQPAPAHLGVVAGEQDLGGRGAMGLQRLLPGAHEQALARARRRLLGLQVERPPEWQTEPAAARAPPRLTTPPGPCAPPPPGRAMSAQSPRDPGAVHRAGGRLDQQGGADLHHQPPRRRQPLRRARPGGRGGRAPRPAAMTAEALIRLRLNRAHHRLHREREGGRAADHAAVAVHGGHLVRRAVDLVQPPSLLQPQQAAGALAAPRIAARRRSRRCARPPATPGRCAPPPGSPAPCRPWARRWRQTPTGPGAGPPVASTRRCAGRWPALPRRCARRRPPAPRPTSPPRSRAATSRTAGGRCRARGPDRGRPRPPPPARPDVRAPRP